MGEDSNKENRMDARL